VALELDGSVPLDLEGIRQDETQAMMRLHDFQQIRAPMCGTPGQQFAYEVDKRF